MWNLGEYKCRFLIHQLTIHQIYELSNSLIIIMVPICMLLKMKSEVLKRKLGEG
jgi:hypothetical protein